jgi:hypothetical protein
VMDDFYAGSRIDGEVRRLPDLRSPINRETVDRIRDCSKRRQ